MKSANAGLWLMLIGLPAFALAGGDVGGLLTTLMAVIALAVILSLLGLPVLAAIPAAVAMIMFPLPSLIVLGIALVVWIFLE